MSETGMTPTSNLNTKATTPQNTELITKYPAKDKKDKCVFRLQILLDI